MLSRSSIYNDLSDEMAEKYFRRCGFHANTAALEPVQFAVTDWKIPSYYPLCGKDLGVPWAFQGKVSRFNPDIKTVFSFLCPFKL
jgi:hypothetical protein